MKIIRVSLGSTSSQKLAAVVQAFEALDIEATITGVYASSEQNDQPVGHDETFKGALNRALRAQARDPGSMAIGIESGIIRFKAKKPTTQDVAVIVILTTEGRQIIKTSEGFEFPEDCVEIAKKRGFEATTVGSVIAEKFGGDPADPHFTLSDEKTSRTTIITKALVEALKEI
ncbi:MAG: DUF84 family protein [bacterium]